MKESPSNSIRVVWMLCILITLSQLFIKINGYSKFNFLSWDVLGYYSYLPFNLIYDDPGMRNQETVSYIFNTYQPSSTYYQAFQLENGNYISSYTIGMSVLYLPFFAAGHLIAAISNYPADGFSTPYQLAISLGMMIYFFIGLFYLRKLLLRFFNDGITTVTLLIVVLGTNIFHEAFNDSLEPHAALFAFYSILMYKVNTWYRNKTFLQSYFIGALTGLILIIRGSEIPAFFIIILWGCNSIRGLKLHIFKIIKDFRYYLIVAAGVLTVASIQIIHWKLIAGEWIFNNVKNGEGFNFAEPKFVDFFFSFKKGVFIYTPLVVFCILGMFTERFRRSTVSLAIICFFILNTYLIASWLVWWGGASFGSRYFAHGIAILTIPLAFFVQWVFEVNYRKIIFITICSLLVALNLFQTWQFMHGIISQANMTKAYYKKVFLKTSVPDDAYGLLEPDLETPGTNDFPGEANFNKHTVFYMDFDSINTAVYNEAFVNHNLSYDGTNSYRLDTDNIYSPTFRYPVKYLTPDGYAWIGISVYYYSFLDIQLSPLSIVASMSITGNGRDHTKYRGLDLETLDFKKGEWNKATFYYLTPRAFSDSDQLIVYIYNRGKNEIFIDRFQIVCYTPK